MDSLASLKRRARGGYDNPDTDPDKFRPRKNEKRPEKNRKKKSSTFSRAGEVSRFGTINDQSKGIQLFNYQSLEANWVPKTGNSVINATFSPPNQPDAKIAMDFFPRNRIHNPILIKSGSGHILIWLSSGSVDIVKHEKNYIEHREIDMLTGQSKDISGVFNKTTYKRKAPAWIVFSPTTTALLQPEQGAEFTLTTLDKATISKFNPTESVDFKEAKKVSNETSTLQKVLTLGAYTHKDARIYHIPLPLYPVLQPKLESRDEKHLTVALFEGGPELSIQRLDKTLSSETHPESFQVIRVLGGYLDVVSKNPSTIVAKNFFEKGTFRSSNDPSVRLHSNLGPNTLQIGDIAMIAPNTPHSLVPVPGSPVLIASVYYPTSIKHERLTIHETTSSASNSDRLYF